MYRPKSARPLDLLTCCPTISSVPILTLDHVSLAFGHHPLFEEADLRIEPGERLALIGRNGSGKSTLLKVVSGEQAPDSGTIWRAPALRLARLPQDVPAAGSRTVAEVVAEGLHGVPHEGWGLDHKVDTVMSRLALPAERPVEE